jgi:hypothetical protein
MTYITEEGGGANPVSNGDVLAIYDSKKAYRIACEQLARFADIEEQCRKSGAQYDKNSDSVIIKYLGRPYILVPSTGEISLKDSEEQIPTREKVLILHYLLSAKGTPLTGTLITYKQVPGGTPYFARFSQLAVEPLLSHFGEEPALIIPAAEQLGGKQINRGDAAVTINAFDRVPLTIVLQKGDEEFSPTASLLFDSTISDYLPSQDIRILCEIIVWKLIGNV